MQEEGAFPPIGGCLSMFLQMPIFFGLFSALRTAFDLRQEPFFFWIDDLARPDRLFEINLALPIIGTIQYLNLLPLLMMVTWGVSARMQPLPVDPQQQQQAKMMRWMPMMFGLMLYNFASGLALYMTMSALWSIGEVTLIRKVWLSKLEQMPTPAPATAK